MSEYSSTRVPNVSAQNWTELFFSIFFSTKCSSGLSKFGFDKPADSFSLAIQNFSPKNFQVFKTIPRKCSSWKVIYVLTTLLNLFLSESRKFWLFPQKRIIAFSKNVSVKCFSGHPEGKFDKSTENFPHRGLKTITEILKVLKLFLSFP